MLGNAGHGGDLGFVASVNNAKLGIRPRPILASPITQETFRIALINQAAAKADAENHSYALWNAAFGAAAVFGVWYFFLRGAA